ncbi:MAG: thiamine pyrophosphate-binding protein, partial [Micrococcales bacterium]|nr:thiamine pyrophosphate-binding protein [Micrococcales bacterium]
MPNEVLTGAQAIVRSLELLGIDTIFGLPGGAILPTYDPLMDSKKIRHILVRHEQGAGHAAEGYASASGKLGVCIATSGPGATNLVTAIADAHMDSVPMLAITGQVPSTHIGTDAFQEADIVGITMPITKHSFLVTKAEDIPGVIAAAVQIATTGRPGPVLVDVAKDAQNQKAEFIWPPKIDLPGFKPTTKAHGKQIAAAADLILSSSKPVLYIGGGSIRAGAHKELLKIAELTGAPAVTTLMARGALPDTHPQNLGMPGMHGTVPAVTALQKSDLLITLGARFEIGKIRHADVPIVGDLKEVLQELNAELEAKTKGKKPDLKEWWVFIDGLKTRYPLGYDWPEDGMLSPQYVIERIGELSGPEAIFAAGVGQHQMWSAQFIKYERPNSWLNSGGAGTMGYSVPAAMGAKVAQPERLVWAIDGDGCFQMTNQELATCTINDIPIKVAII